MKKLLYIVPLLLGIVLTSCYDEDIEKINGRLDAIENTQIATISQQITSINNSIQLLTDTDTELKNYITTLKTEADALEVKLTEAIATEKAIILAELEAIKTTISELKAKDSALEGQIADLKTYVDNKLKEAEDWATATFATLEQHNALASELASLKTYVEGVENSLNDAISALETSMKKWVNEQLTGYYTIAEIDAKLEALETATTEGDEALQKEIYALKEQLDAQKTELTEAYTKAIEEAINTNNGVIDRKIATEISAVNEKIAGLEKRLNDLEERVELLEEQIDDLINRKLEITFNKVGDVAISAGGYCEIDYSITSSELEVHIATITQNGWKAVITKETTKTGFITVHAPNPLNSEPVIVLVSDANTTIMRTLTFVDGITTIATKSYAVPSNATTISVGVQTNMEYEVRIPSVAQSWISLQDISTRAVMRNDIINISIAENSSKTSRSTTLLLVSGDMEVGTVSIYQQGIEIANNELIYKNYWNSYPITPYQTMGFAANIVSNTYASGKGLIVFDKDITSISEYAFYECDKLKAIQMPSSIKEIRDYAFYDCYHLIDVALSNNITSIGDSAFRACTSLTNIAIPDSVILIGDYAFYGCTSLTSVTIPDSVTSIGDYAFSDCTSLKSLTIGDGVTSIGDNAFIYCTSLTSIYFKATMPPRLGYCVFNNNASSKIYVPSKSVTAYKNAWSSYSNYIVGYDFK